MTKNGFTLVELLIGMLIGMLCMIMMLMLFKQISRVGMVSARDAEYDAQLETGVLIAQKLIQNAGYGSGKASDIATGFVTFSSTTAADATATGRPTIFWRISPNPNVTPISFNCYGLTETITPNGANQIHRLVYLEKIGCNSDPTLLTGMQTWTARSIARLDSQSANPVFSFVKGGTCAPFGVKDLQGGAKITITGNRLNVSGGLGQSIQRAVCLRNIP